ncbi:zinc ribbon domain-containing protein [Halobaculum rubrum]|uniref:zinc ribbon domain-containing protein n=1 Tax=Halobaculum rubrum TaxID=2872158 RepID=UPI001CA40700|nr:zinc ribbon domain-containing protein [Halobaculum rubrum]QZY00863.1 hypothetical protein K6T25_07340 [Halobaculum rubrum]
MDWIDRNLPDDLEISVVNETGSRTRANVGCRADGDVLFVDRVTLAPGERREWSKSVTGTVDVGVQVRDGPEATERFDPTDGSGRVSATIAARSISFSTAGGRGDAGGVGSGGGVDSFAAAETSDDAGFGAAAHDGDDGWGFDGNSTDDDAWGFDDGTAGADADHAADTVDTGSSESTSASSDDSGWGFGDENDTGDGDATDGRSDNDDRGSSDRNRTGGSDSTERSSASTDAGGSTDRSSSRGRTGSAGDSDESTAPDRTARGGSRRSGRGGDADRSDGVHETEATDATDAGVDGVDRDGGVDDRGGGSGDESDGNAEPGKAGEDAGGPDGTEVDESGEEENRQAGAGEKYCRSCGAVIKQEAAICPECGVSNEGSVGGGAGAAGAAGAGPEPEPSDWGTGVLFGGALWGINLVVVLLLVVTFRSSMAGGLDAGGALRSLGLATVLPLTQFLAWLVFAVAIYYDMKYVRYHVPDWPLSGTLYIAAAIVLPVFTQVFGAAALFVGGPVGLAVAALVPAVLLGLAVRHTRTRKRLISSA